MNKRIVYTNANGGTSVIIPAPGCGLSIEQIAAKDVPAGIDYWIVDADAIPADRTFRNAWEKSGSSIGVNLSKAKGIAHDKRRAKRAAEFAPLDIETTIPGKASAAESARQAIRDKYAAMQADIDGCDSVESLKSIFNAM